MQDASSRGIFPVQVCARNGMSYILFLPAHDRDAHEENIAATAAFDHVQNFILSFVLPGKTVLDIGANVGAVTIPLAKRGIHVVAYEALAANVEALRLAVEANHLGNLVTVHHAACWDRPGKLKIGGHSAWGCVSDGGVEEVDAITVDLDLTQDAKISAIKIDVEGAELRVLKGMVHLLKSQKPHVIFESNTEVLPAFGTSAAEIIAFFKSLGYRTYRLCWEHLVPGPPPQEQIVCDFLATTEPEDSLRRTAKCDIRAFEPNELIASIAHQETMSDAHRMHVLAVKDHLPKEVINSRTLRPLITDWMIRFGDNPRIELCRRGTFGPAPRTELHSNAWQRTANGLRSLVHRKLSLPMKRMRAGALTRFRRSPLWHVDVPPPSLERLASQAPTRPQFESDIYRYWCGQIREHPRFHRKQWEFVYILEALRQADMLQAGRTGIGFGVGREPIPAILAAHGCRVLATDLEPSAAGTAGWEHTGQYASSKALLNEREICPPRQFDELVTLKHIDMADLRPLAGASYDFVWSSCALEHIGSLGSGIEFILESLALLRPGGVAVHTTEFNISSDEETITSGCTVLYRRRDIEELVALLSARGHQIEANFAIDWDDEYGGYVDVPPYNSDRHLRLLIGRFISTSFGLLIHKQNT
jgi:FkbM family methyltransferase